MATIDAAFTAVGAPAFSTSSNSGCAWTSTETDPRYPVNYYVDKLDADNFSPKNEYSWFTVFAFVHF